MIPSYWSPFSTSDRSSNWSNISTQTLGYTGEPKPIYVDEQLTHETFILFKHAKNFKKSGYNYTWIANGDIMAWLNSTAPLVKITSKQQVDQKERDVFLKKQSDNARSNKRSSARTSSKPTPTINNVTPRSTGDPNANKRKPIANEKKRKPIKAQTHD